MTQTGANEDNALTGDLDIKANLTINGGGASATVIDGNNADRVFEVFPGFTLAINNVTIQHGNATNIANPGGAIRSLGALTLANTVVTDVPYLLKR